MIRMMLIRHGHCDPVGKYLAGRSKGIHLTARGSYEVHQLCKEVLLGNDLDLIFSSPLERTMETAKIIQEYYHKEIVVDENLIEIEYGNWTGLTFSQLESDPFWATFNASRLCNRIPEGEMFIEVQARMSSLLDSYRQRYDGKTIAIVSHCDPLKVILSLLLGFSLQHIDAITIDTASLTVIETDLYSINLKRLNDVASERIQGFV